MIACSIETDQRDLFTIVYNKFMQTNHEHI